MTKCPYSLAWIGLCGAEAGTDGYCEAHSGLKCQSCGNQAAGECSYTGQFVCGFPLCPDCTGWEDRSKESGSWGFMNHTHVSKQWLAQRAKDAS